jgi:hypothetical protein
VATAGSRGFPSEVAEGADGLRGTKGARGVSLKASLEGLSGVLKTYVRGVHVNDELVLELLGEEGLGDAEQAGVGVRADGERHRQHDERLADDVEQLERGKDGRGVELVT